MIVLILPAALFATFVYLAIGRIRHRFTQRRYSSRSDQRVSHNFISEQFVPNEQHKAQQRFIDQILAPEVSAEEISHTPSPDVDRPTQESDGSF